MPAHRRKRVARRTPVRRRRRSMGQKITKAKLNSAVMDAVKGGLGGVIASVLTNTVGKQAGGEGFAPYTGLAGSVATSLFFKQPAIAAGMAGYAGTKVLSSLPGVGGFLAGHGMEGYHTMSNMFLQDNGEGLYASDYTLSGYEVPGL
tara:strand:- start:1473 stop:1913 length:441 start_codon:yes stop_codon:yes gene_type:complete